jgi:hypothetical protein
MSQAAPGEDNLLIGDFNVVPDILSDAVSVADRTVETGVDPEQPGRAHREPRLSGQESASQEIRGYAEGIDVVAEAK